MYIFPGESWLEAAANTQPSSEAIKARQARLLQRTECQHEREQQMERERLCRLQQSIIIIHMYVHTYTHICTKALLAHVIVRNKTSVEDEL